MSSIVHDDTSSYVHIMASARDFVKRHSALVPADLWNHGPPACQELSSRDYVFPQPPPLRLDLSLGINHAVAEKISSAYTRVALRLKTEYEGNFRRICHGYIQFRSPICRDPARVQSSLHSISVSKYTERVSAWVEQIQIYTAQILQARQRQRTSGSHDTPRRSFSQRTVSILEKFFQHNAFPSRMDKQSLATEANITFSQVHIWFQNRRRRFRKEGKELKRGDPALILPSELENSIVELLAPTKHICKKDIANITLCGASDIPADILSLKAPLHAYPSAYPPTCSYDPFPIKDGMRAFSTPWPRKSTSSSTRSILDINIAQLSAAFMKLTLVDDPQRGASHIASQSHYTPHPRLSDMLGFTVITSPAPHPAFVSAAITIPSMSGAGAAAQPTSLEASRMGVSYSKITTDDARTKKPMFGRKVAPLPKRLPISVSTAHRSIPPVVPGVLTPSSCSTSRSSSTTSTADSATMWSTHSSTPTTADNLPKYVASHCTSSRSVDAQPKRASAYTPFSPPPRFTSTSLRTPSASSSTSSGSSSPSGPDTPLSTPPKFPMPLPASKASRALGPASSFSSLFSETFLGELLLAEGLQLRFEPTVPIASYAP